jgi:hypothetical protein
MHDTFCECPKKLLENLMQKCNNHFIELGPVLARKMRSKFNFKHIGALWLAARAKHMTVNFKCIDRTFSVIPSKKDSGLDQGSQNVEK